MGLRLGWPVGSAWGRLSVPAPQTPKRLKTTPTKQQQKYAPKTHRHARKRVSGHPRHRSERRCSVAARVNGGWGPVLLLHAKISGAVVLTLTVREKWGSGFLRRWVALWAPRLLGTALKNVCACKPGRFTRAQGLETAAWVRIRCRDGTRRPCPRHQQHPIAAECGTPSTCGHRESVEGCPMHPRAAVVLALSPLYGRTMLRRSVDTPPHTPGALWERVSNRAHVAAQRRNAAQRPLVTAANNSTQCNSPKN